MPDEHAPDDSVATLRRWEDSGAVWRVLSQAGDTVTVGMFTCDGGEEIARFTTDDPRLSRFVEERRNGQG